MDEELFIESINAIQQQYEHDYKCSQAFKTILNNDYISGYNNDIIHLQLIKILETLISKNYNREQSWIDYFIYDLDFGKQWSPGMIIINKKDFKLQTPKDLWDLLNKDDE